MVKVFHLNELEIEERPSPIPDFLWKRSAHLGELADSRYLHFDILVLPPGKFSYPYHSHRNAEELFYQHSNQAEMDSHFRGIDMFF